MLGSLAAPSRDAALDRGREIARELLLLGSVLAAYEIGRLLVEPDPATAVARARDILRLEAQLGLMVEAQLQHAIAAWPGVVAAANQYYSLMFLPANLAFLGWVYLRHPCCYPLVRNIALLGDGIGFVVHWAIPVAPPRLLPGSPIVDTLAAAGHPLAYGSTGFGSVANPYAAMPSLHFAWALLVGAGVVALARSRWRWLGLLHPVLMGFAIVATGNHFVLDAVGGAAVVATSATVTLGASSLAARRRRAQDRAPEQAGLWRSMEGCDVGSGAS